MAIQHMAIRTVALAPAVGAAMEPYPQVTNCMPPKFSKWQKYKNVSTYNLEVALRTSEHLWSPHLPPLETDSCVG